MRRVSLKKSLGALLPWLVFFVLLGLMCAARGAAASADVSYNITDGDFQNYNPVRRLLAGQAPYGDFAVYLGAGELYSVAAVLLVIGNSFAHSVFAADFLTWLFYGLLALAVGYLVLGSGRAARGFALGVTALHFTFAPDWLLGYAAGVGNSARMIRFGAAPLLALGLAFVLPRTRRSWLWWPLLAGAMVPWSNDVGGAAYLAAALAYGLLLLRAHGRDGKAVALKTLRYIAVSVVGLGLSVLVISWGHPLAWLRLTRGASADQVWYYGSRPQDRLLYLTDFEPSPYFLLMLAACVLLAVAVFQAPARRQALRAAGLFALCLCAALWELLYAVGSGVRTGTEGGKLVAWLVLPAAALWAVNRALPAGRWRRWAAPAAAALACAAGVYALAALPAQDPALSWQPELGGYMGDQADKLNTERTLTGGAAVFSTYAGGLETLTGQFQPTGTDYIIHALGDRQRLHYLTTFQTADFAYTVTPSPKVAEYERWARNANWWFYSDLYRHWKPVGTTYACGGMHLLWQRTGDSDLGEPVTVTLEPLSDTEVRLTARAAPGSVFSGVADVTLRYHLTPRPGCLHHYFYAFCDTETALWAARGRDSEPLGFFLPTDRNEWRIPVTMDNGVGVVTLSAHGASLADCSAEATATFVDWEYFFE